MTIIGPLLFGHVWVPVCVCLQDYLSMGDYYGKDQGFLVHTTFRLSIYGWWTIMQTD